MRVMVPAIGTEVAGVNTRTGAGAAPLVEEATVIEENVNPVTASAFTPVDKPVSTLDDILKPPLIAARAPPRVNPVRVMVIAEMPDAAPAVVRTMVVLEDVAAGVEVAVKVATVLAMEATVPKK